MLYLKIIRDWIKYYLFYFWRKPTPFLKKPYNLYNRDRIRNWQSRQRYITKDKQDGVINMKAAEEIHLWVLKNIKYVSDETQWHVKEYWPTSEEVMKRKADDCDGIAVAHWFMLRDCGFPDDSIGMVMTDNHMFACIYDEDDDFWVLDNGYLTTKIVRASKLFPHSKGGSPIAGFNLFDAWSYKVSG